MQVEVKTTSVEKGLQNTAGQLTVWLTTSHYFQKNISHTVMLTSFCDCKVL